MRFCLRALSVALSLLLGTLLLWSCAKDEMEEVVTPEESLPKILSFSLLAKDNPECLVEDCVGVIVGDSLIKCRIPHLIPSRYLIPRIGFEGDRISTGEGRIDFSRPQEITVYNMEGKEKQYRCEVTTYTELPVLFIETENRDTILSRDNYLQGRIKVEADNHPEYHLETSLKIRGRGNSTWEEMPKKSYRIKLTTKESILGMPANKDWILLANYADKTMLRTETGFNMSRKSSMIYTPQTKFVELILNGEYAGTYQLVEKLEIAKTRINLSENGYLLEIDGKSKPEDVLFNVAHIRFPISIKDPEVKVGDEKYKFISDTVNEIDSVLFSDNFQSEISKYIDLTSFADWYLINEIARNQDAYFYTSCYMTYDQLEGKLRMGPVWDFDLSFGNPFHMDDGNSEGYHILKYTAWYKQLFKSSDFVDLVKERFKLFYDQMTEQMNSINENASLLRYSVVENDNKWHTLYNYTWPNYNVWGSYLNEVQQMKNWYQARMAWLKSEYNI